MTPQGRPPHEAGKQEEAFRSPSSPKEDPPKTNSVKKGREPDCKIYVSVIILKDKNKIYLPKYFCSLIARLRASPLAGAVR